MLARRRVAVALEVDQAYPHHQEVFAGVYEYGRKHPHWECVIDEHPGHVARGGKQSLDRYDGVVARALPEMQKRLARSGIPLVNTWYQHARQGVAGVYLDRVRVGQMAAEHLTERGFRRLAYLYPESYRGEMEIGRAFGQRAAEAGAECQLGMFKDGAVADRAYWMYLRSYLEQFLDGLTPPVGVLAVIPWLARSLVALCHNRGWQIPQDVALVCKDDVRSIVEPPPGISCIDCQYTRVGHEAAALLERLMAGEPPPEQPILIPPKGIIARESTDYFAVEDETVAQALRYISKHLNEQLTVDQISQEICVSSRSLKRRFTAVLGRPISNEIRRLRLARAQRLLGEKDLQIKQIAQMTGFSSSMIMGRVFQRELGMTPGAYRKQVLGERQR